MTEGTDGDETDTPKNVGHEDIIEMNVQPSSAPVGTLAFAEASHRQFNNQRQIVPQPRVRQIDPNQKCHLCNEFGINRCNWDNNACRRHMKGGCNKKYCDKHKWTKFIVHYRMTVKSCTDCAHALEKDMRANNMCRLC